MRWWTASGGWNENQVASIEIKRFGPFRKDFIDGGIHDNPVGGVVLDVWVERLIDETSFTRIANAIPAAAANEQVGIQCLERVWDAVVSKDDVTDCQQMNLEGETRRRLAE